MEPITKRRVEVCLPCDQPNWNKLTTSIEKLNYLNPTDINELELILKELQEIAEEDCERPRYLSSTATEFYFGGLINFLEHDASHDEKENFFGRILPMIASLALEIETLRPGPLAYSLQQQGMYCTS